MATPHNVSSKRSRDRDADPAVHPLTSPSKRPTRKSDICCNRDSPYSVFISHAGPDKATIAIPLREKLRAKNISAFVDVADLQPGCEAPQTMMDAIETANVAVIVLSPEFISRRWPMRELMCFLRRRQDCANSDRPRPIVIPLFYRLKIEELYDEPRLDRLDKDGNLLYRTRESNFYERQERGEPEADIERIKGAVMSVRGLTGLTNFVGASNDSSYNMSRLRNVLLEKICEMVELAIREEGVKRRYDDEGSGDDQDGITVEESFRKLFPPLSSGVRAVLDFESRDEGGNSKTTEGMVKQHLLEESNDSPHIVSLHGIGGVGKSTILQTLSVDNDIRKRFPGGVHVIKLGKDASNVTLFREVCRVLEECGAQGTDGSPLIQNDMNATLRVFENWFKRKKCAFLIDDVWMDGVDLSSLSRFCHITDTSGNSVLITTREPKIASVAPSNKIIQLEPREARGVIAREILYFHADCEEADGSSTSADESINEILDICDGLPVNLAVAGKNVKSLLMDFGEQHVWKEYLSELVTCRASLLRENVGSYGNLYATFATSIRILDKQCGEETLEFALSLSFGQMYRRLCVLQKQARVPMSMLRHLWETESEIQAKKIGRKFVERGLASHEIVRVEGEYVRHLSMHDSLHEFVVEEAKRKYERKESHDYLLKGYMSLDPEISSKVRGTSKWWSRKMESDGYIHENVCRHLFRAGRSSELVELLLCPEWVKRQVEVNDIVCVETDFSFGMKAVQDLEDDISKYEVCEVKEAIALISEAVTLSSGFISKNEAELSFQLHGRLKRYCESNRVIETYVLWFERNSERPLILCETSFLGEAGTSNTRIVSIGRPVYCMIPMRDGERFAFGCLDGLIALVNVKRSIVEKEWMSPDRVVDSITITSDGTQLISGSGENRVRVWDVESGDCVTSFNDHTDIVNGVGVMKDGRRAISVSLDCTARIWSLETGEILSKPFTIHDDRNIRCVTVLGREEEVVITGGDDAKLRMWSVVTGSQIGDTFDGHDNQVSCVTGTPDGHYVVSGSSDKTVRVWDVRTQQQIGDSLKGHTNEVSCVGVSGDGSRLVSGSLDKTIRVWDLKSQTEICDPLEGHTDFVEGVSFVGGSIDCVVSCSWDGTVRVWDVTRRSTKKKTNRHESGVCSVCFTPDERHLVSGSDDKTIRVWERSTGEQVGALQRHSECVTDVCVTPNGRYVVSVSDDKKVLIWDLKSLKLVRTLTGHTDWIECVAVTPQGDQVVTGSYDRTVRIWDLVAMDDSHVILNEHECLVLRVFVSDDGLRVVSVDEYDNIFVWELKTKKVVRKFTEEDARKLSRRQILNIIGETTLHDDTRLSIPLFGREILYGEGANQKVLATMDSMICSWALSPDKKRICVGLEDGQVGFMKLER